MRFIPKEKFKELCNEKFSNEDLDPRNYNGTPFNASIHETAGKITGKTVSKQNKHAKPKPKKKSKVAILAEFNVESELMKKTTLNAYCRENGLTVHRQHELEIFTRRLACDELVQEAKELAEKHNQPENLLAVITDLADNMLDDISKGTDIVPYCGDYKTAIDIMFYRAVLEIPGAYAEFLNEICGAAIAELNETI